MVRFLLHRPIAVLMTFIALIVAGLILIKKIPVSLLPNIDVPQIVIKINYPNISAAVLEQNIVQPIRESLVNINSIKNIETRSANHTGLLYLTFEYGTRMNLSFVEVNEKLDRLASSLPRDMERPQVMRINTSDIPVIHIQVIPKEGSNYLEVSSLTEKVLKKRLEQLEGVSLVDINGKQLNIITVTPDKELLSAVGLDENTIIQTIRNSNKELGGLSVKDGQYRYFVKLMNTLEGEEAIANLLIPLKNGSVILLSKVAEVGREPERQTGYHLYNGKEGLVITVQKQPDSRMNELVPKVKDIIEIFKADYPQVNFEITQDQTFLLDAGISNLEQDLIYGGILTVLLLFMFLGNLASPTLMSISIPISLIITFIFFYFLGISFNIISLSGLALGIGMLIDNSIVVIDNITRKRRMGFSMLESSVEGTNEVMTPVISQVLTTVAVYAPLILLSGMAGALVFDQALGLTISLGVSLLVAFVLAPMLYKLFLKRSPQKLKEDTFFYTWVSKGYHKMISHILKYKLLYFLFTILLMPVGFLLSSQIPVTALPDIEKKESLVFIDWNAPIDAQENLRRVKELQFEIQKSCTTTEAEIGIKQFLLQQNTNTIQQAEVYFACMNKKLKIEMDELVKMWLRNHYSQASFQIADAPNAFTQLFSSSVPYFEARFKPIKTITSVNTYNGVKEIVNVIPYKNISLGPGLIAEQSISIFLDYKKMAVYGVNKSAIEDALQQQFGVYNISEIKHFGQLQTIRLKTDKITWESKLRNTVKGNNGTPYPMNYFLTLRNEQQPKFITSDKTGEYKSIVFDDKTKNISQIEMQLTKLAAENGFSVSFQGQYFENRQQLKQLWIIFLIVLFLLYLILAIQYENLIQPVIVMLTIPLGITGGMFFLWLTNGTLDVMAAIGFIVILGLIVDDPILKIETLNRLEKQYLASGFKHDDLLLERMIHEAGDLCLKPLLMVSLTTSIAMVPVLFIGGIGNDLQRPLAVVIIGGLTIGTFFTTWFIPLAYWYVVKIKLKLGLLKV